MRKWILTLIVILFVGCGGGGADPDPDGTIEGWAFVSGPLEEATIDLYVLDARGKTNLFTTTTNSEGYWKAALPENLNGALLVEATGGHYRELADGRSITLISGQTLQAIANTQENRLVLSPFSTLAAGLHEFLRDSDDAVAYANGKIAYLYGFNFLTTLPDNQGAIDSEGARFYQTLAGLSSVSGWAKVGTVDLALAGQQDLSSDGRINGVGRSGALLLGSIPLSPEFYRHDLALNLLSSAEKRGDSISTLLPYAQEISEREAFEISGEPTSLDFSSPRIFNISHISGQVLSGQESVSVVAISPIGVNSCELFVGEAYHSTSPETNKAVFNLDTTVLPDGQHTLKFSCADIDGGRAERELTISVGNAGTQITNIWPRDGDIIGGKYNFRAMISDPYGVQSVKFLVNGETYYPDSLTAPALTINTGEFIDQSASYTMNVTVLNQVGETTEKEVQFSLDNDPPTASWNLDEVEAVSGHLSISGVFGDAIGVERAELFVGGEAASRVLTESPFDVGVDTESLGGDGERLITLEVSDVAGNTTTLVKQILVDNTPPTLELINPLDGDVLTSDTLMSALYEDAGGIDEALTWLVDGVRYSQSSPHGSGRVSTELNVSNYSRGPHTVGISVTDRAGNTTTETVNVVFDY